eukprot:430411_1
MFACQHLAQTISVLWTGEPLQHSKTINFVLNIFKKILLNPKDAKYGNLNLRRVQKRIETTPNVIHLLFKAGFIESPDRTRLLWIYSDENYHSLKTVNDSVERKIMTKEPQNESPKSVLQTQLYDENAISALLEMGLNRDDCIMASQLAANYKDPTSIFEALAGLLPTLKDPNPPPKQDKPVPMFNNDTLAHVLCSQALSQYFHMNSQAMRQSLASDQNNMQKLEQLRNEILSMEPTRLDWHQPHVSEDDLCRCCPDYSKIRPTRQDIAARNNQNDFKYFNGMALLNAMQQGTVIRETLNITCSALDTCPGLTTICAVLQRYQWFVASHQIDHEKNVKFADYFGDDYNGVHTLNNFHHLLFDHHAQFEDIYDALINEMSIGCSLQKCQVIRRHYRDRLTDNDCGSDEVMESMELSLLDKIHCYYLHSFDIGYKFRKHVQDKLWNERRHESHDEENKENDAIENDTHNSLDGAIHTLITSNRRSYEAVEGLDRILNGNNRFHTEMDEKTDGMTYDHGRRFFYWDYYRNVDQVNDPVLLQYDFIGGAGFQRGRGDEIEANIGYSVKDWYIKQKYNNLKAELLQNHICKISTGVWQHDLAKATQHSKTDHAKSMKSRDVQTYGIRASQPLSLFHILAMMSYCNHDVLQAKFSGTFRQNPNESDDAFKQRHRHFAHFARLLREVVECYGQQNIDGPNCHNQILFHGVSQQAQFQTINPCFKGPVSATTAYAVALGFSLCTDLAGTGNGCVIQFRLNKTWLYQRGLMRSNQSTASFLDVEWLSDYPNEQERFFIGGYARFSIESIVMWPNINYEKYLTAMRAIWQKIGYLHISPPILSNCTTKLAYKMLSHEFHRYWPNNKHYDSFNAMDEYAEKLFHNFCINLRVVWFFAMKRGCGTYEKMDKFLDHMFLYDNGMPKLKETMTLFPSATEIRIKTNCNGTSKDNVQMISNHSFWKLLLVDLKQTSSLTELIVEFSSNAKCADVIKTMGEQYATQLNRIGWKVAHGTSQRYANPDHTLIIEADKPSRKVVTD